jgi:ribosomal protein L11 methyltransferase
MQAYHVIINLDASEVADLEELAWEHDCSCITHQPPHVDDWPAETSDLPATGPVITIISFSTEEEAIQFDQYLKGINRWDSKFEIEEILPWIEYHKPFMQPIKIENLTILPEEPKNPLAPLTLYLPAGLAFGTGHHPTTRSCLKLCQQIDLKNKLIVDFGCGSGVLGLASLIFGAKKVLAHDHDMQALESTKYNTQQHGFMNELSVIEKAEDLKKADVLFANILLEPLLKLNQQLADLVNSGGFGIFSGILDSQAADFLKVYLNHFDVVHEIHDDEWTSFLLRRK